MTAPLFLAPHVAPVGDSLRIGADVLLDGAEGRHAAAVRRVRVGERVDVTDGAGLRLECIVAGLIGKEAVRLTVVDHVVEQSPSPRLIVVQAIPKGDRGELAVEVMTEAGVDVVVPWAASRCVAQWRGERGAKSVNRWRRTAHEAAKQAHRAWLPEVRDQATTAEVAELLRGAALGVVLHEEATRPVTTTPVPPVGDVVVVVGPEGGVAPDEIEAFAAAGAHTLRLGPTVMRTSTAGVVALGVLLSRTARWA
jgi:16S rRNA (uracil1498-N3)-methyltransferase